MSLLFIDGFDHFDPAALRPNGLACAGYGKAVYAGACQSVDGRRAGGRALRYDANHARLETMFSKIVASPASTLICGCAVRLEGLPTVGVRLPLLFVENNASTPQRHEIHIADDGTLQLWKYESGYYTRLGASWVTLTPGAWRYLELKVVEGSGTGSVEARLDGLVVLTVTGLSITTGGKLQRAGVCVKALSSTLPALSIDDFYLINTSGSLNNTYLGDVRIDALRPMAAGGSTQWTPVGAAANWDAVDDAWPNEADYVTAATLGQRDLYAMQDLPAMTSPTVLAVQSVLLASKADAGSAGVKAVAASGASTAMGALHNLAMDPQYFTHVYETDPNTSAAWTEAGLNAAQFGVEVQN